MEKYLRPATPLPLEPERERTFIFLLLGTSAFTLIVFILLIIGALIKNATTLPGRMVIITMASAALFLMFTLWRKAKYRLAATLLVLFYGVIASLIIITWGIATTFGILLLSVTVVLASILLGPRQSLYAAGAATFVLIGLQIVIDFGWYTPLESTVRPTVLGEVFGYSAIFAVLGLVSWLFGKNMEASLKKARAAEAALSKEKELLEVRVAERTLELEALQFQEMQQLYRFAEMGQLSAALLHDLANQLTVLTLDIEDLQQRAPRSEAVSRARNSVRHLEHMIDRVRAQLQGENPERRFHLAKRIKETLQLLKQKAHGKQVTLEFETSGKTSTMLTGDPTRLSQAIAIIITNAIDAYARTKSPSKKVVKLQLSEDANTFFIAITDWGAGISPEHRQKIFEPFFTTKETGMGIGLFIAKQIIENHFHGSLALDPATEYTKFILSLPKSPKKQNDR
ncbi:MAG TPA: HAMP domain-containing sensor histidine kinase [Verrucomicrobiae bacterium]|nr:HAMP domain-containing sensor histidine kinase [Verrucomicrobiae bacterium]